MIRGCPEFVGSSFSRFSRFSWFSYSLFLIRCYPEFIGASILMSGNQLLSHPVNPRNPVNPVQDLFFCFSAAASAGNQLRPSFRIIECSAEPKPSVCRQPGAKLLRYRREPSHIACHHTYSCCLPALHWNCEQFRRAERRRKLARSFRLVLPWKPASFTRKAEKRTCFWT